MPRSGRELPGILAPRNWLGARHTDVPGAHVESHSGQAKTWALAVAAAAAPGEESALNGGSARPWGYRVGVRTGTVGLRQEACQ